MLNNSDFNVDVDDKGNERLSKLSVLGIVLLSIFCCLANFPDEKGIDFFDLSSSKFDFVLDFLVLNVSGAGKVDEDEEPSDSGRVGGGDVGGLK